MHKKNFNTTRNYGIDLLRMLAMFFVVILHVLEHGGITSSCLLLSSSYYICWFIEIGCYCAVNCYALISGYVGYESHFKYANILLLYCQTVFYALSITIAFNIFLPQAVTTRDYLKALFPFSYDTYWYFSSYFCIFFFIPFFNYLIRNLEKKQASLLICSSIILFSIIPTIFNNDIFQINNGFSALWLSTLYLIGAYIKKYKPLANYKPTFFLLIYLFVITFTWLSKTGTEIISSKTGITLCDSFLFVSYISPTILLAGISLLLAFSALRLKNTFEKIVIFFTPLVFGIYLIHDHLLVRAHIINGLFATYASQPPIKLIVLLLLTAFSIWFICSMIDYIRHKLFSFFKLKHYCMLIENIIISKLGNYF